MVTTTQFTPYWSLFGGLLIGLSAVLLMGFNGRIAGIAGLTARVFEPRTDQSTRNESLGFVAGLFAAVPLYMMVTGGGIAQAVSSNSVLMALAGLLVGFGATYGSGCTSGHGVCGMSRLSVRSIVATSTFMAVAIVTVYVTRHVIGGM